MMKKAWVSCMSLEEKTGLNPGKTCYSTAAGHGFPVGKS
jgi:hypothetical protein